jgi:hypothetical protein
MHGFVSNQGAPLVVLSKRKSIPPQKGLNIRTNTHLDRDVWIPPCGKRPDTAYSAPLPVDSLLKSAADVASKIVEEAKHVEEVGLARGIRSNEQYPARQENVNLLEVLPVLKLQTSEP